MKKTVALAVKRGEITYSAGELRITLTRRTKMKPQRSKPRKYTNAKTESQKREMMAQRLADLERRVLRIEKSS